jgi:hypothetical protein
METRLPALASKLRSTGLLVAVMPLGATTLCLVMCVVLKESVVKLIGNRS